MIGARVRATAVAILALTASACSGVEGNSHWGSGATLTPDMKRLGDALETAATDPHTWAPALGAAAFQIGDADAEVAEWARAPAPEDEWLRSKVKGFSVGTGAMVATGGLTSVLKSTIDRRRPSGGDDRSFPSGHTSASAVSTALARDAVRYYDLSRPQRVAADVGLAGLTAATGWARLEAGAHYPSDTLAAMAIGNFFATFATEAFLKPEMDSPPEVSVAPAAGGGFLVRLGFKL